MVHCRMGRGRTGTLLACYLVIGMERNKNKVLVIIDKNPFQIAFHGAVDADAAIRTVRERRCGKSFLKHFFLFCRLLFFYYFMVEAIVCVANAVVAAALVLVCYSSFCHSCFVVAVAVAVAVAVVDFAIFVATSGYSPRESSHFILAGKMLICLKLCQCCFCCCCCCSVLVVFFVAVVVLSWLSVVAVVVVAAAAAVAAFPSTVSLSPLQTWQHRSS